MSDPRQTTLDEILPPHNGSRTSRAAAEWVAEHGAQSMLERVYAWLDAQGLTGGTIEEISEALGLRIQTVCGRIGNLRDQCRVYDSGRTRELSSGRQGIVWYARKLP